MKLPTPSEIENHIAKLQESLALMHKSIVQTSSNERQAHRNSDKKFRQKPNFTVGDYVLIGIAEQHSNRKLYLKWRGPYRVIDTLNNYVFQVENLITKEQKQIHGDRMLFYCDSRLNVTEELKTQFAFDNERFEVENVCDARKNPQTGDIELLIRWKGFSEAENSWNQRALSLRMLRR